MLNERERYVSQHCLKSLSCHSVFGQVNRTAHSKFLGREFHTGIRAYVSVGRVEKRGSGRQQLEGGANYPQWLRCEALDQVGKLVLTEMLVRPPQSATMTAKLELMRRSKKSPPLATRISGFCFASAFQISISPSLWQTLTQSPSEKIPGNPGHALEGCWQMTVHDELLCLYSAELVSPS